MPKSRKKQRKSKAPGGADAALSPHARADTMSRATAALNAGDVANAERLAKRIIRSDPAAFGAIEVLASVHFRKGDAKAAAVLLRKATANAPAHPGIHFNLGIALYHSGEGDAAVESLQKALYLDPNYPDGYFELGGILNSLGRGEGAVEAYKESLRRRPNDAFALSNLALAQFELGQTDEALANYHSAIKLDPQNPFIRHNLLDALERRNRIDEMRTALADADATIGHHPQFALARAELQKRDKDFDGAIATLEAVQPQKHGNDIGDPKFWRQRAYALGDLYDRQNMPDQAIQCFSESNRLMAQQECPPDVDKLAYQQRVNMLRTFFSPETIATWNHVEPSDGRQDPVFMVGFPRSGTTLLDMVLRGHPEIAAIEELPLFSAAVDLLKTFPGGEPDAYGQLNSDQVQQLRDTYFAEMDKSLSAAERERPVIVDKLPLNLIEAGPILRIFPNARFILALRHPCDCVLSCYMHAFKLNSAMANFLNLEDAAALYGNVFSLWQQYCDHLPLKFQALRYEDMIGDLEGTVRPLLEFLDLPWDNGVLAYAETAQKSRINTPSYHQVVQPLYKRADGRWIKYAEQMAPVIPHLQKWISQFGYD